MADPPNADSPTAAWLIELGQVPYEQALDWQAQLVAQRLENPHLADVLLLLEHPPVYTLGRGATLDHLRFCPDQPPAPLHRIGRGGEVTYHCPGQIVGYPILNLQRHQTDLHWYLRRLEDVLIAVLAQSGLKGDRLAGLTGIWVEGHKVAAIGIQCRRWITQHGFALNVCPDLSGFGAIVPCGIGDRPVGSLAQFCPEFSLADVRRQMISSFATVFQLDLQPCSLEQAMAQASTRTPFQKAT
jgi:lipoyl(octanoyl) transferase